MNRVYLTSKTDSAVKHQRCSQGHKVDKMEYKVLDYQADS